MQYDVVVVGAGPGGATAARIAAQAGLFTLLVDREVFPRSKPCAGGVTAAALAALDFRVPDQVIERCCYTIHPRYDQLVVNVSRPEMVVAMVSRTSFDAFLRDKAAEAGAEIREGTRVKSLDQDTDGVTLTTNAGSIRTRLVVGADGVFSTVARHVRAPYSQWDIGLCQWADIPCDPATLDPSLADGLEIRYGTPVTGYGWIFPKSNHVSVGIGTVDSHLTAPRVEFDRFLSVSRLPRPDRVRGYVVPLGGKRRLVTAGRIMLVGDAAGYVDPFTGEGIRYAIKSGRFAAETAAAALKGNSRTPDLAAYPLRCEEDFNRDLGYARLFMRIFMSLDARVNALLFRHSALFEHLTDILQGRGTYRQLIGLCGAKLPTYWLQGIFSRRREDSPANLPGRG